MTHLVIHLARLCSAAMMLCLAMVVEAMPIEDLASADSTTTTERHRRTQVVVPASTEMLDTVVPPSPHATLSNVEADTFHLSTPDSIATLKGVKMLESPDSAAVEALGKKRVFNPDPIKALWLSVLCPGLGQIYNRRYWKLPIVVGAFVGLSYGMTWNNRMLTDYSRAYRDAMDDDPETRSYMDLYPPTVKEEDLDMEWLKKALKNKRDYYRRYRDICIISMVAVYALSVIDAYVDASLAHFDISPDLSMRVAPTVIEGRDMSRSTSVGVQCAFKF